MLMYLQLVDIRKRVKNVKCLKLNKYTYFAQCGPSEPIFTVMCWNTSRNIVTSLTTLMRVEHKTNNNDFLQCFFFVDIYRKC